MVQDVRDDEQTKNENGGTGLTAVDGVSVSVPTPELPHVETITEVEIDPDVWYRGHTTTGSALLRQDGRMCCIGIASKAAGVADEKLFHRTVIQSDLALLIPGWGAPFFAAYTRLYYTYDEAMRVYELNDKPHIEDSDRVQLLNAELERLSIPLRFRLKVIATDDQPLSEASGSVPSAAPKDSSSSSPITHTDERATS